MAKSSATKGPPLKGGAKKSARKGSPMMKFLLVSAVLAGLGFAAYAVPVGGKTLVEYARNDFPWTVEIKRRPAVTKGSPNAPPAETITASEREALDQLVRR